MSAKQERGSVVLPRLSSTSTLEDVITGASASVVAAAAGAAVFTTTSSACSSSSDSLYDPEDEEELLPLLPLLPAAAAAPNPVVAALLLLARDPNPTLAFIPPALNPPKEVVAIAPTGAEPELPNVCPAPKRLGCIEPFEVAETPNVLRPNAGCMVFDPADPRGVVDPKPDPEPKLGVVSAPALAGLRLVNKLFPDVFPLAEVPPKDRFP
mmetsp:Transcript_37447/g.74608  ORF Transcript_37447/g.74608 Transcript_37447/m.74608 type:complete len:210 (-) Transcript_37447:62-691(-)